MKKQDLQHGKYYQGNCRNATIARWNGKEEEFYHWRFKFGHWFVDNICCAEDDDEYDVFIAEKLLEEVEKEIPFD